MRRASLLLVLVAMLAFGGSAAASNGPPVACGATCDPGGGYTGCKTISERLAGLFDQARPRRLVLQAPRRHHEHLDRRALLRCRRTGLVLSDRRLEDGWRRRQHVGDVRSSRPMDGQYPAYLQQHRCCRSHRADHRRLMKDTWCKRLAIIAAVWAVLALTLQIAVSLAFR